jgi:predicted RNase H-like nuclease (RuvC/YqgF family)
MSSKNDDTSVTTNTTGNQFVERRDHEAIPKLYSVQPSSSGEDESSSGGKDESKNTSPAVSSVSSFDSNPTYSSIRLLRQAILGNGPRPVHLSTDEKALWDAMQSVRYQAHQEGMQQAKKEMSSTSGMYQRNSSPQSVDTSWDVGFVELQEQAVSQQRDNSRSLQVIQRILSDQVALTQQDHGPHDITSTVNTSSTKTIGTEEALHRDLLAMSEHIISLEKELRSSHAEPEVKVSVEPYDTNAAELEASIERLEQENESLVEKIEWKDLVIEQLEKQVESVKVRRGTMDSVDSAASVMSETQTNHFQMDEIRKELMEKSSALENAKMIIASLENASGSLAADLKRKLRERDDDLKNLQRELKEKQRTLDTLATELRDVQNTAAMAVPLQNTEAAQVKRLQLSSRLETNLAEIRAAAVILESTQDATAVSNLSELLSDSASVLRDGIDVIENGLPEERRGPLRLHKELEEKNAALKILEDKLRAQAAEASRYRITSEDMLRRRDEEISALRAEIKILRQQCTTNMEVLTRKERELAVLRDSLRVDDDGVGYISDDDDADEDDQNVISSSASKSIPHLSLDYGPSQAEALATLLLHTNVNRSLDSGLNRDQTTAMQATIPVAQPATSNEELESLRAELNMARSESEKAQRQLLVEKESLSNAKMIISSLERASKTMMEDLRARLQDSNTAIASLLEKSMESEKTSARLRSELDALKRSQCSSEPDETHLMLAPAPQPLLLTETID